MLAKRSLVGAVGAACLSIAFLETVSVLPAGATPITYTVDETGLVSQDPPAHPEVGFPNGNN